jgi:hypothetical protein
MRRRRADRRRPYRLCRRISRRDAAAIVFHSNGIIFFDGDFDMRAVAGHGFVDAVVNNFIDQMVQAALVGAANVHTGTAAHRFPSA